MTAGVRVALAGMVLSAGIMLLVYVVTTAGDQIMAALVGGLCVGVAMSLVVKS